MVAFRAGSRRSPVWRNPSEAARRADGKTLLMVSHDTAALERGGPRAGHGRTQPRRGGCVTILTIALKYLRGRLVASALTAVSVALGVGLVIASMLMARGSGRPSSPAPPTTTSWWAPRAARCSSCSGSCSASTSRRRTSSTRPTGPARGSARRGGGAGDGRRRLSGLPLRGDERRVFRRASVAAQDLLRSRRAGYFRDDPPDAPTLRGSARRGSCAQHGTADRRSLLRGRGDGRVSVHRGRHPEADAQRRRPRDLLVAGELLGDERGCAGAWRSSR